jgi:hypothetical protein
MLVGGGGAIDLSATPVEPETQRDWSFQMAFATSCQRLGMLYTLLSV